MMRAYEEIIDFLASGPTPAALVAFHASAKAGRRVADLIERERSAALSPDETDELNRFLELEHLIRLIKARARARLAEP